MLSVSSAQCEAASTTPRLTTASQTAAPDYHGPGRGAGNAINALIDGFRVTGRRAYLKKAEELIHRTIHPDDRPDQMGFDNLELRWSYLVFLQTLGLRLSCRQPIRCLRAYSLRSVQLFQFLPSV